MKTLCSHLVLQVPDAVAVRELLVRGAAFGQNAALKATHVEQQVRIVFAVDRHKAVLPQSGRHRTRQTVLYVPEHCSATAQHQQSSLKHTHTHTRGIR